MHPGLHARALRRVARRCKPSPGTNSAVGCLGSGTGSSLPFPVGTTLHRQMGRPLRIEFPGAVYHVTSRGNRREMTYRDDEDASTG